MKSDLKGQGAAWRTRFCRESNCEVSCEEVESSENSMRGICKVKLMIGAELRYILYS